MKKFIIDWEDKRPYFIFADTHCSKCNDNNRVYDLDVIRVIFKRYECLYCKYKVEKVRGKYG